MSVTGTGAGSLSVSGSATAYAYPIASGSGSLSLSGDGSASAHPAATGNGSLSITGNGAGASHPAATGSGTLSISGTGAAVGYVSATGAGSLSITGAATGGPVVTGTGAGSFSIIGDGGDTPRGIGAGSLSLSGSGSAWSGIAASGVWLYIHTTPPAQVYAVDALRGRLHPSLPMHRVPFTVSATQAQLGQRNDSFSVTLDSPATTLRRHLSEQAPYGVRVDVMDGGTLSRSGIVSQVESRAGGLLELDCEAPGWSDDLPLRTSADLGEFGELSPLPWRYGRSVSGECVRLNAAGTRWLWADHACSRVTSLEVDGQPYDAWAWRNDTDANGRPICIVQTSDPQPEGTRVVATGDGALDPLSGTLASNPADVFAAICAAAGVEVDRGDLVPLRVECIGRGLEVAGTITGGSLQSVLTEIAASIYAAFSRELPGLMRLLPRSSPTITIPSRDTPTGTAQRQEIATRVRARYAVRDGKPRASVEVAAPAIETLRGRVLSEVTLAWVSDARTAADVADRMLSDASRPRYRVSVARQQRRLVPGDVVSASVPALGLSGAALVVASTIDERGSVPTITLAAGSAPSTAIVASTATYEPETYTGVNVATVNGDRVVTITDTSGRPIAGASCRLNGSITRTSDSAGRVAFPVAQMPPGSHVIDITAQGFQPFRLAVRV